jgi:hypothetical protein
MQNQSELTSALRPVVAFLEASKTRYFVGGSVASSYHGASRSTLDVDLTAQLNAASVPELCLALSDQYYLNEQSIRSAIRRNSCFNLIHLESSFKVDIFVRDTSPYSEISQQRAIVAELGDNPTLPVRMATIEDIIVIKLDWYRIGGEVSERQWNDMLSVAKLNAKLLDVQYLREWTQKKGLLPLLERLLKESYVHSN